jgi:hypothetical protein
MNWMPHVVLEDGWASPRRRFDDTAARRYTSGAMIQTPELSLPQQIAWQAEFIFDNFQHTDYQFAENIDVDRGIYDCDCNGYVGFVLQRAAPGHYGMIPVEPDHQRPRAYLYYRFFAGNALPVGWQRIASLPDALPGDIIAWEFSQKDIDEHKNTGHVFFVAESPIIIDPGLGIYAVRTYDSAQVPHFDDTRGDGDTGIGSGLINFTVNDAGAPQSFQFGPSPSEDKWVTVPIAIGRVEPLP